MPKPLKTPINRLGGKSRLKTTITPIIENTPHTTYIEPFMGGGSVFFWKTPSEIEVINDINPDLMEFYTKLQSLPSNHQCPKTIVTQKDFDRARQKFQKGQDWDVCDYLLLNKNSFLGNMEGYHRDKRCKSQCGMKQTEDNFNAYKTRLQQTQIHNTDYQKILKQYDSPDSFFFLDPPYTTDSSTLYRTDLNQVTPEKILDNTKHLKGKVLITFNDDPKIKQLFKKEGFHVQKVQTKYNLGQNWRDKTELLITNFKP